jgi:hypothetical protein
MRIYYTYELYEKIVTWENKILEKFSLFYFTVFETWTWSRFRKRFSQFTLSLQTFQTGRRQFNFLYFSIFWTKCWENKNLRLFSKTLKIVFFEKSTICTKMKRHFFTLCTVYNCHRTFEYQKYSYATRKCDKKYSK